jgi:hypothetical protein
MNLTDRDVRNTEKISKVLNTRSNAEAVSAALGITSSLADIIKKGNELIMRNKKGELQQLLIIPGLGKDDE